MKKNSILMLVMTLFMAYGVTLDVMAKKIEYLGHYYNGKVNKQKIPEGEGGIAIGNVAVFGTFNANNITNAKIEEDWLRLNGAISFDESDKITVKAGSHIEIRIFTATGANKVEFENDLNINKNSFFYKDYMLGNSYITLDKDSIIDLASTSFIVPLIYKPRKSFLTDYPSKVVGIPVELLTKNIRYQVKDYMGHTTNQWAERKTIICKSNYNNLDDVEYSLDNFKDSQGRIWNVNKPKGADYYVGKVTYPNGSFIQKRDGEAFENFEVKFPQGFSVIPKISATGCNYCIIFPDSIELSIPSGNEYKFEKLIDKKKMEKGTIYNISFPESIISTLSDNEMSKIIKEKLSAVIPDYDFNTNDLFHNALSFYNLEDKNALEVRQIGGSLSETGGYFYDGHYVSRKSLYAKKDADKAAADKAFKAEVAKFKSKYGFSPVNTPWKQVVKPGRTIAAFNACNEFLDSHGYVWMGTKLTYEDGGAKHYKMTLSKGTFMGYMVVRNGVISSVAWH